MIDLANVRIEKNNSTKTHHTISIEDKDVIFKDSDKNLLICLESQGIEVHSHCRDGFCGVCRVKLEQGSVSYPNGDPLAYIAENEILPCCCVPKSDLKISID